MTRHKASMDWFGSDGQAEVRIPCFVEFNDRNIKITYGREEKSCSNAGQDHTGHGHYTGSPGEPAEAPY